MVFLSPPWGGPTYLAAMPLKSNHDSTVESAKEVPLEAHPEYSLSSVQPVHGSQLFELSRKITRNIAFFLPRNTNIKEISNLTTTSEDSDPTEIVEIEEEWMGSKLKALTCYFGGLANGQSQLF